MGLLTDVQVYCMTSMIYLFRSPLTVKAIYRKTAEAKLYTNINSLIYRKEYDNMYDIMKCDVNRFDMSDYSSDNDIPLAIKKFLALKMRTTVLS